jgi:hypothetical protein
MSNGDEWEAWIDLMPGPGEEPTLHVTGVCECPTTGWSAELTKHEPQGGNPRDLLLDLVRHEPTGSVNPVITMVPVSYTERAEKGEYHTVSIASEGPTGIPVKERE